MNDLVREIQDAQRDAGEAAAMAGLETSCLVVKTNAEMLSDAASAAHCAADAAERTWHAYACLLDVGHDRTHAFAVYENLRNARRKR